MTARDEAIDSIILRLNEGTIDPAGWAAFLEAARAFTRADYASIVFRRADASFYDLRVLSCGTHGPARDMTGLEAVLSRCQLPYHRLVSERPYALHDILAMDGTGRDEYRAYLAHSALIDTVVVRVTEPEGGNAWLTLGRSRRPFGGAAIGFLGRIAPHLRVATRTLAVLERARMRGDVATDAMKRLGLGWISFDARGRVVDLDGPVERSLGIATPGDPLRLTAPAQAAVRDAIAACIADPHAAPRAIRLSEEPWLDMVVAPIAYRAVSRGITPVAVGYVRGVADDLAARCDALARFFALTASEARLALAITRGRSIAEAAADLNLSIETARAYSKRLYAKTGTKGQTDLVRTILAGVLALA